MWGSSEEPPGTMEAGPPESVADLKESCEQSKNQLESVKDIMLKNKENLKKKEEELQEYAKKLSKFKTRAKARSKDDASSSDSTPKSKSDTSMVEQSDDIDDISQARTPKAKSSLLQKKLAEDREIFEQRSKELAQSKRAVEEKVEALRQQFEDKYVAPVSAVSPILVTSQTAHPVIELSSVQDKDNKITELNSKILGLEAIIIDLQENLKEKDSVIDSKTKAITLMSADLSKKGKTTLDTLEDTKDEMRTMQENFVLVETSLRDKNENLLKQLEAKATEISVLEENVQRLEKNLETQKEAETVSADFSRSTMDTLADTKDAMKSMQENFVLIESSLKSKNEHLLKQLEEREIKLAEAESKILNLESGLGIERQPNLEDLSYKIGKLEEINRKLEDEKYELQKSITDLQDKILNSESSSSNLSIEKDNHITELKSRIEELGKSKLALEEEHTELQSRIDNLNGAKQDLSDKVIDLERQVQDLQNEKADLLTKLIVTENATTKEDDKVQLLTKELDELNKSMIKLKAQHKNKMKTLQKQLENFKKVSDTNAELVKLGNQVALLEEEKASAGDLQQRINDLEGKVSTQEKEIQTHIEAIAILENQKLDLMQELHSVKQEVSSLEAEIAESENLRVTAEMKVVDLEEQLDSIHKLPAESLPSEHERAELQRQIDSLTQENERLVQKVGKLEELKNSSEVGSTESFVKTGSNVDSTESFEALAADADKADLLRKIDGLMRENGVLLEKLTRFEEKGSSDAGSTESFEKIPEHGENASRLDNLTRENYELVVKLTKLEEKLAALQSEPESNVLLAQENERLLAQVVELQEQLALEEPGNVNAIREKRSVEEHQLETTTTVDETSTAPPATEQPTVSVDELIARIESLTELNEKLTASLQEFEQEKFTPTSKIEEEPADEKEAVAEKLHEEPVVAVKESLIEASAHHEESEDRSAETVALLEAEIERCNALIVDQKGVIEDMKTKLAEKEQELECKSGQISSEHASSEIDVNALRRELEESASVIQEWRHKCAEMEDKMQALEHGKQQIENGLRALQEENNNLLKQSEQKDALVISLKEELDQAINNFEIKLKEQSDVISSQDQLVQELKNDVASKDQELHAKYSQLQSDLTKIDELQDELNKLEAQVQQRDATIVSLTEEVETLRTNASVVEEDLFMTRHQLTDLLEKLENSKTIEEYNQVAERVNDKEILIEELQNTIAQKIAEANTLKSQAEALAAEKEQLRGSLEEEERKVLVLLESNRDQEEALRNAERTKAEVENRLLDLQTTHEEHLRHARNVTSELQDAYRMLEQLKIKHTEDIDMLNRRLEDTLEDLIAKSNDVSSMQSEIDEKSNIIKRSVTEDVKVVLETQVTELEGKLAEAEAKAQAQLEKMKKYAALAKKKSAQCEELEAKLHELEETLSLEKNEKEAKNRELQESQSYVREKDNKIANLEEELQQAQSQRDEALQITESIKVELNDAKERINSFNEEIKGLLEAKDNARELSVRMQVMESEYVDQLTQINTLRTENGLLLSKQAQINEKLENVEKESEEHRSKLEKLEKEKEIEETRRSEECGQCASRLQALEAKLQERDAEIENLDNELHNSIGNLVQMQEDLRLSTLASAQPDPAIQHSHNELLAQFNALTATNQETLAKYESTLKENEALIERVDKLQELNSTMQERVNTLEAEVTKNKEAAESYESIHVQYIQLVEKFDKQKEELEITQAKLKHALESSEASEHHLALKIEQLEQEKLTLEQQLETLKDAKASAVSSDGWEFDMEAPVIGLEAQQLAQDPMNETATRQKRETVETEVETFEKEDAPPLFDSSVFGATPSQVANPEQHMEIERLKEQINILEGQVSSMEQSQENLKAELQQARGTNESLTEELRLLSMARVELESVLAAQGDEAAAIRVELSSSNEALAAIKAEYERIVSVLEEKNAWIDGAAHERTSYLSQLEQLTSERQEIESVIDQLLFNLAVVDVESSSNVQKLRSLELRLGEILSELETLRSENQDLSATQEVYKKRAVELENEVRATSDGERVTELENRVARVISERDILQLQVNDVTRAFDDFKESSESLRSLQVQLDEVSKERNQLVEELEALKASKEKEQVESLPIDKEVSVVDAASEKLVEPTSESMWEDDEDPWGFNDRQPIEHVDIPVVPSAEIEMKLKVDELEEKLKELTDENVKLAEECKMAQVKIGKYVKKLKEYKVQFDSLQRQVKSQKAFGGLSDDAGFGAMIEDEFKSQIAVLEKALAETKDEYKKVNAEKEKHLQRIDVLTAAMERFTEAKEKQDMEVHIWQMRYKELEQKLQQLDFGPETNDSSSSPPQRSLDIDPKYENELKELKENVEALAAENDELQQLLEEHRVKRQASVEDNSNQLRELNAQNLELAASNDKLKSDYDALRKQFEQSLMDANDQVQSTRQNSQLLQDELSEKIAENERVQVELNEKLNDVLMEKAQLESTIHKLESDIEKLNTTTSSLDELSELLNIRVQEVASLKEMLQAQQSEKIQFEENSRATIEQLTADLNDKRAHLDTVNIAITEKDAEISNLVEEVEGLRDKVKGLELSIEGYTVEVEEKNIEIVTLNERISSYEAVLAEKDQQVMVQQSQFQQAAAEFQQCNSQVQNQAEILQKLLEAEKQITELNAMIAEREISVTQEKEELLQRLSAAESHIVQLNLIITEKETTIEQTNDEIQKLKLDLQSKQDEAEGAKTKLEALLQEEQNIVVQKDVSSNLEASKPVEDDIPVFTFASNDDKDQKIQKLRAEIEHLQFSLSESNLTRMIQDLQDNVNSLYNERSELEKQLIARNQEINALKSQMEELQPHQDRRKRSLGEQEELIKLQNELHERDQQMNELKYIVAEKESQLRAALEQASGEYELQESAEKLRTDLYEKQQELESLKFTVSDLQSEVANLRGLERLAAEDRATIERLSSEKEEVRRQAEEAVDRILKEKEAELDGIKKQLADENKQLLEALGIRERDLENLKIQIERTGSDSHELLEHNTKELTRLELELSERDRRLAELSITKETELHNLRVQLSEKNARLEELVALSEEEERQLAEMRQLIAVKDQQISGLTQQLDEKTKEYELMQHALQRHIGDAEKLAQAQLQPTEGAMGGVAATELSNLSANELDVALYMLHQRDVRCEELTQELMQLIEERDVLQLKLSNAIRMNEELRKYTTAAVDSTSTKDSSTSGNAEPLVEDPSPSKSEGPVEIAKEAINLPGDEKALAQKLTELKSLGQMRRDPVVKEDREMRHQQMTMIEHGEIMSKLPPEAAARLVNANYTLSRDVQSQSSVLMNWLWGKSTPKVVHM